MAGLFDRPPAKPQQGLLGAIFSGMGRGLTNPGGFFVNEGAPAAQALGNMMLAPFVQANQAMPWGGNDPRAIGIDPQQGSIDPSVMVPWATDVAGTVTAGAGLAPPVMGGAGMGIRAYHGSPHDFERFNMDKIGTGEGAQAYGHGLYFAEQEGTAKTYRDMATRRSMDRQVEGGGRVPDWVGGRIEAGEPVDDYIQQFKARVAEAEERVASKAPQYWNDASNIPGLQEIVRSLEKVKAGAKLKPPGRMYEVDIDASPDEFLDWDKPLSEQPEMFKRLQDAGVIDDKAPPNQKTGQADGRAVVQTPGGSDRLRAAGIKGIRYKDAGSRSPNISETDRGLLETAERQLRQLEKERAASPSLAGEIDEAIRQVTQQRNELQRRMNPTHNYVVFDDKTISILKKYGLAGLTAGGAGAAMLGGGTDQASAAQPPWMTGGRF